MGRLATGVKLVSQLEVSDTTVPVLLKKLLTREWLVPQFQRDFVWTNAAVISLVNSIIDARPIGMVTLWEQPDNPALLLEPVSVPDWITETGKPGRREYAINCDHPGRYYAVLDGRQRSTALALAFGGLKAESGVYKNAGSYFLDVTAKDDGERVKFFSTKDIARKNIGTLPGAIGIGLFPLAAKDPDDMMGQWMQYLQAIYNKDYYKEGAMPNEEELKRRNNVLSHAFTGIFKTKLAVYTVPKTYSLSEICEIFSTLNQTGVKVSTVDLIHSNLYNDTITDKSGPLLLREQIDSLGEMDGAVGWADSKDRPELVAQLVAAAYVAAEVKPAPRQTGSKEIKISSVKSGDLLAIPSAFWRKVFQEAGLFANFLGGFQQAVAGGSFGMNHCPYPASAALYVGLRWYRHFDGENVHWDVDKLDRLYRAFFWRNSLTSRYDQGFLSQIGTDISDMKAFLNAFTPDTNDDYWRSQANSWLDAKIAPRPGIDDLISLATDGQERGALRRTALLLHYARAKQDVVNTEYSISHESGALDLHHIFPRDWCKNNSSSVQCIAGSTPDDAKWINSAANLMPMHRKTNNDWRKSSPLTFLQTNNIDYESRKHLWNWYFIDKEAFDDLLIGEAGTESFWKHRGRMIAEEIYSKTAV